MAIVAAGTRPDRIVAVTSFHGGNLATDEPDSPHRQASTLKAELYIASAENDDSYPPVMADRFERAMRAADAACRVETYPAAHGGMMPDFPVYDEVAAERSWREMLALVGCTLPQSSD
jgi:carboxymethylenebutenolidase